MIRSMVAAAALTILAAPAQAAGGPECRSIQDSLLRLRCYDDANAKPSPAPSTGATKAGGFDAYPSRPYAGPVKLPSFTGATAEYRDFRTRIRDGMREGPNFAGHLALIQFGCGTGCSVVLVGDVASGSVANFPLGGEDVQMLELDFRRDSDLVVAKWQENQRCVTGHYRWTGSRFDKISGKDIGPAQAC